MLAAPGRHRHRTGPAAGYAAGQAGALLSDTRYLRPWDAQTKIATAAAAHRRPRRAAPPRPLPGPEAATRAQPASQGLARLHALPAQAWTAPAPCPGPP